MLPNGNVLVFDNGIYRTHDWLTHSKVLEINPQTNQVEWEYADEPVWDFYSPTVSGAQRLANGNTLITEGTAGRLFQVTQDGKIVWEYVNPFFHLNTRNWEVKGNGLTTPPPTGGPVDYILRSKTVAFCFLFVKDVKEA